jgi:hypothetical protein
MRQSPERPRLRKREIAFAVAAGVVAAGGAALVLDSDGDSERRAPVAAIAGPNAKTYQLADFDEVSTSGPQDVVIMLGDKFEVRSEGSPESLALLEPVVVDGKLTIQPRDGFNWNRNAGRLEPATFYVTLPRLDGVAIAGSGEVSVLQLKGEKFDGSIAGSGELSLEGIDVDEADFSINGSGNVSASGKARQTRVNINGQGEVEAGGLLSQLASIAIGGSGEVAMTVVDEAKVSITGSGEVDISGPGRCSVTRYGSGEVRCDGGGGTDD